MMAFKHMPPAKGHNGKKFKGKNLVTIMRSETKRQGILRLKTPAKITTFLQVLGMRSDGFHEVRIALAPVSLFDRLTLGPRDSPGISLRVESPDPLGVVEDNLVYRAALAFQKKLGRPLAVDFELRKMIPSGAGLGGGSANAAGALLALNAFHQNPLTRENLLEIGLALGSDVPFFLQPRPALAGGRGEALEPLRGFPSFSVLVVKPPFAIATGWAYGQVKSNAGRPGPPALDSLEAVVAGLRNDFEPVLFAHHPELGRIKDALLAHHAAGALLSGSGSAVFGVYATKKRRDDALAALAGEGSWQLLPCEVLAEHRYLS